jgi:hypothetical protein
MPNDGPFADKESLKMEATDKGLDYWLSQPYVTDAMRSEVSQADIVLIPHEKVLDRNGPFFPGGTEDLLEFLRDQTSRNELCVDICVDDSAYCEFALYSELLEISHILVKDLALPILVGLVVQYVSRHVWRSKEERRVRLEIIVEQNSAHVKKCLAISYDGSPDDLRTALDAAVETVRGQSCKDEL